MKNKRKPRLEEYLSVSELADMFGVSSQTVYRWVRSGEMRAYEIGIPGIIRIKPEDLPIEIISNPLTEEESGRVSELSSELTDLLLQSQNSLHISDNLDPAVWLEDSAQQFLYKVEKRTRESDFESERVVFYLRDQKNQGKAGRVNSMYLLRGIPCYSSNDEITNRKEVFDQNSFAIFDTEKVLDIEVNQGKPGKSRIISGSEAKRYLERYEKSKKRSSKLRLDEYGRSNPKWNAINVHMNGKAEFKNLKNALDAKQD